MLTDYSIVVLSHLRWDFVYQRPQHLLSRLAANHPILFVEEPTYDEKTQPRWDLSTPAPNVLVCRPIVANPEPGFSDEHLPVLTTMLHDLLESQGVGNYIVWLYTPMALPLAQTLHPKAVVFDVMDELSAFLNAPADLLRREADLLRLADVVFTGGPSLYKAKQGRNPNLHLFPSSVDAAHFAQARTLSEPDDQSSLPHPRLGFYGVIDERMDLALLDRLAISHPKWQIMMIGPVVKIDPSTLPQRSNLHFMGGRSYQELPLYLAGWDVCLLPFALNESTKFISPTKTLEYMAAELPIISTPIADVAEPYGDIVYLGRTSDDFIAACEQALSAPESERAARINMGRQVLARTSWDATAHSIEQLIDEAVLRNAEATEPAGVA